MEACVSAVPVYEEVVRLMKVEYTEKVTGKVTGGLNQILRGQTSRFHYGSKVPAVTTTVFTTVKLLM